MFRIFPLLLLSALLLVFPVVAQQGIDFDPDLTDIWQYVDRQPDDLGVVCLPLWNPSQGFSYNTTEVFPLASAGKLVVLIEYARQLDSGAIPLSEVVGLEQLERYNMPRTNSNAHERFLASYPDDKPITQVSLWDVATRGMMQYSSNAATDYLLGRLGPVDWAALYAELGVGSTDAPHPLGLIPLMMGNHETGPPTLEMMESVDFRANAQDQLAQFWFDPDWRQAEIDYRAQRRRGFPSWDVQTEVLETTMSSTARDLTTLMLVVYDDGGPLNANVKSLVRTGMRWLNNGDIDATYREYGSKLGYYSGGVQTLVTYGEPINGSPVITVILMREIERWDFYDMLRADVIGDMAHWMILNQCAGLPERLTVVTAEGS